MYIKLPYRIEIFPENEKLCIYITTETHPNAVCVYISVEVGVHVYDHATWISF